MKSMKKKVLILINNSTGIHDFRMELVGELCKIYDEVVISTPNNGFFDAIRETGARIIETDVDRRGINPFTDFKLLLAYKKIIKQEKPDVVITYTIKPNVYGGIACRLKKIPYAVNITGLGTAFENGGILKRLVTILNKIACKEAKVIFFENEGNRQVFINEGIAKESQTYRLNGAGVNLEKFSMIDYPAGDTIKFLFMGRVMAEKGIDELFAAMRKLISDGIKCELELLGRYEENYKETIKAYEDEGWLTYYGYQSDVRPFIANCHCFVLPSWHEGMANTNLECAASGRPVITSNIHGCLEAVEDGESGYLCEIKNADNLYQIMKRFAELPTDQRIAMGLAGRKRMEEIFDKKKVVEETIAHLL